MRFSTLLVSLAASASLAVAQEPPAEAVCPGSYPSAFNTSDANGEGYTLTIDSSNPLIHGRSLQLRESKDGNSTRWLGVVDAWSPVASANFVDGVFTVGEGLTANTRNVTGNETNFYAELFFEKAEEGKANIDWYALGLGDPTGRFNVYHKQRYRYQNGFIACQNKEEDYWHLHYNSMAEGGPQHECEWIGLKLYVSPLLDGGECSMPPATSNTVWPVNPPGVPDDVPPFPPLEEVATYLTGKDAETVA